MASPIFLPLVKKKKKKKKKGREGKPSKIKAVEMTVENQSYCVQQKSQKQK